MAKQRMPHIVEFKREVVRLVYEQDRTYAAAAAHMDVDKSTIRDWCNKAAAGMLDGSNAAAPVRPADAALRCKNPVLRGVALTV